MRTQTATAKHIVSAGGAYLLMVKGNQPNLLAWAKSKNWKALPVTRSTEFSHGRPVTRSMKVLQVTPEDA